MLQQPRSQPGLASTPLLLQCLGATRLLDRSGSEFTPRSRKARAILAMLALTGKSISRARLAGLLWSDRGEEQARSSMRQAIFELRHLFAGSRLIGSRGVDEIELESKQLVTDLALVRTAAENGDHRQLVQLLSAAEPGLLIDLDGLDSEFDAWLQVQRGAEPAETLAVVLDAATRALDGAEVRVAQELVAAVQQLDPCSEEAVRIAMRVDHARGAQGSLHRHFNIFRVRLRDELDAEPSAATADLFRQLTHVHGRDGPAAEQQARLHHQPQEEALVGTPVRPPAARRTWLSLAMPVVALVALVGLVLWRERSPPQQQAALPLIAVLPFQQSPAEDGFLAEGLSDDTRAALSQSRAMLVLGPTSTRTLVEEGARPQAYRDRFGVSHLLEGRVRRIGDRVRVSVSAARAADGVSIWQESFEARLGDPLALQQALARLIEGRLRGRLAPGGGVRAEQIATSPEVYAQFSKARSLLRERDADQWDLAIELLRRAVDEDPNFAPAWAALAAARAVQIDPKLGADGQAQAIAAARRALALAPNLAQAHAALAIARGIGAPEAERALERAVALDPSDVEAWNWLGNARNHQYRFALAQTAYAKAVAVDPLWQPPAQNLAATSARIGNESSLEPLLRKLARAGADEELLLSIRAEAALVKGDYSAAVGPLLKLRRDLAKGALGPGAAALNFGLIRLGYPEVTAQLTRDGPWFGPVLRSKVAPPDLIDGKQIGPKDFWVSAFFPVFASRALVNVGRAAELVDRYRGAFSSPTDFVYTLTARGIFVPVAPTLAVALSSAGDKAEAAALLGAAEKQVHRNWRVAPKDKEPPWDLARIRGAQGRQREALSLVGMALNRGWLPDGLWSPIDIAQEPSLAGLRGTPLFERMRRRILNHTARERAELGPVRI